MADNLSTGSLANLEQRARSNSPPSVISSQFENATPELNNLRALTGFTPEWTLSDTLGRLIEIERARSFRVA